MKLFKKIIENVHFVLPIFITLDGIVNDSISNVAIGMSILFAFIQIKKNFQRIKNCQSWY